MRTAYVLPGGGSIAAAQVGVLQALSGHGTHPDAPVGASASPPRHLLSTRLPYSADRLPSPGRFLPLHDHNPFIDYPRTSRAPSGGRNGELS